MRIQSYLTLIFKQLAKSLLLLVFFLGMTNPTLSQTMVDKRIVMVVDTSSSMSIERYQWVMNGFYDAMSDPAVQSDISKGYYGKIALSMVQFDSGAYVIHDWIIVDQTNVNEYAETLKNQKRVGSGNTNFTAGLLVAKDLILNAKIDSAQTIIVFCADGIVSEGGSSYPLNSKISKNLKTTIIGVSLWTASTPYLPDYLKKMIVSGEGGFATVVKKSEDFKDLMVNILTLNNKEQ